MKSIKDINYKNMNIGESIQYQIATSGRILRFHHGGDKTENPPSKNVSSTGKDVPENSWDRGPETHISFIPVSNDVYQIATSGRILKFDHGGNKTENPPSKNVSSTGKDVPENSWDRGPETHISFIPVSNDVYQIATSGRILRFDHGENKTENPPSKNVSSTGKDVPENSWDRGPETHISFIPVKYKLFAHVTNFKYAVDIDEMLSNSAVNLVIKEIHNNLLPTDNTLAVEKIFTNSSSYSWAFKGELSTKFSNKWTVKAEPKIGPVTIGGAESEISYEAGINLGTEKITAHSKEVTIKSSNTVVIEKGKSVECLWISKTTKDAEIKFNADVIISAKAITIDSQGKECIDTPVSANLLGLLIKDSGYTANNLTLRDDYSLCAELAGEVHADCAYFSEFSANLV